ncbi:MAG: hypothetical protein JJE25_13655, partial [Bacteroidia bacterium]|nr:hypothetical protein [Bacteroidia bacterium]
VSAGDGYFTINFEEYYNAKNFSQKAKLVEGHYEKSNDEHAKDISAALEMYRGLQKIKHKPGQLIARLKKLEITIESIYRDMKAGLLEVMEKSGLPQLKPLTEEEYFSAWYYDIHNPETDDTEHMPASKVMLLSMPEEDKENVVHFLTQEFFNTGFYDSEFVTTQVLNNKPVAERTYFNHCFTLPNINLLSALEIKTIRGQLHASSSVFNAKVNEWMTLFKSKDGESKSKSFFQKEILPSAAELQKRIEENELLRHCSNLQDNDVKIEVYAGAVPAPMIWEFYSYHKVISEKTIEILKREAAKEEWKNKFLPVLILRLPDYPMIPKVQVESGEDIKPVKKSISVD